MEYRGQGAGNGVQLWNVEVVHRVANYGQVDIPASLHKFVTFAAEKEACLTKRGGPNRLRQRYIGTSLITKRLLLGPYSRAMEVREARRPGRGRSHAALGLL